MHPRDTAAFIDGGQGLLPLDSLTNRDGGGSHASVVYPRNTPENHPAAEGCMINSKQHGSSMSGTPSRLPLAAGLITLNLGSWASPPPLTCPHSPPHPFIPCIAPFPVPPFPFPCEWYQGWFGAASAVTWAGQCWVSDQAATSPATTLPYLPSTPCNSPLAFTPLTFCWEVEWQWNQGWFRAATAVRRAEGSRTKISLKNALQACEQVSSGSAWTGPAGLSTCS